MSEGSDPSQFFVFHTYEKMAEYRGKAAEKVIWYWRIKGTDLAEKKEKADKI